MSAPTKAAPDPILLTLFANRFMSVAEAMGRALQQTSISTNIKERLDYSCALFAPDGDLVANAPFIPIHLGSMSLWVALFLLSTVALADHMASKSQSAVKYQMNLLGKDLKNGDVIMTNSPRAGGRFVYTLTTTLPANQLVSAPTISPFY